MEALKIVKEFGSRLLLQQKALHLTPTKMAGEFLYVLELTHKTEEARIFGTHPVT